MLKISHADSADVEAVLRTLQLLSAHESFAQTLVSPALLTPILALVAPHAVPVSSSYLSLFSPPPFLNFADRCLFYIASAE
jgi:hypothetical protein